MAARFFGSDPWDHTLLHHHRKPKTVVSIPVRFVDSPAKNRSPASMAAAAVMLQAAARGFLARRMVRAVGAVEEEAERIAGEVAAAAAAICGDARERARVGELLMRLLLRLDAVRGARGYRRRVARKVLALQDAVDAMAAAAKEASETVAAGIEEDAEGMEQQVPAKGIEMAAQGAMAAEAKEASGTVVAGIKEEAEAVEQDAPAKGGDEVMALQDAIAAIKAKEVPETAAGGIEEEAEATKQEAPGKGGDKAEAVEDEKLTEIVNSNATALEDAVHAMAAEAKDASEAEEKGGTAEGGELMEVVRALWERTAQQGAVVGELAARVGELERAVGRMERKRKQKAARRKPAGNGRKCTRGCVSD